MRGRGEGRKLTKHIKRLQSYMLVALSLYRWFHSSLAGYGRAGVRFCLVYLALIFAFHVKNPCLTVRASDLRLLVLGTLELRTRAITGRWCSLQVRADKLRTFSLALECVARTLSKLGGTYGCRVWEWSTRLGLKRGVAVRQETSWFRRMPLRCP